MQDTSTIGKTMRRVRQNKQLSQEVVSGLAAIARSHLSRIEIGKQRLTIDTYFKICSALCIKPGDLMRMIEDEWKNDCSSVGFDN